MSNIKTPDYLLKATNDQYNLLPRLPKNSSNALAGRVVKQVVKIIGEMTLIWPIVELSALFWIKPLVSIFTQNTMKQLTPLAKQRLKEREKKIQEIAKKVGIVKTRHFKLFVNKES